MIAGAQVSNLRPEILSCRNIFLNCDLDVSKSFLLSCSLRPAARQTGAGDAVPFFGVAQNDATVCHGRNGTPFAKPPAKADEVWSSSP